MRRVIVSETLRIGPMGLQADFVSVAQSRGIVVFAHGSGSSRTSPRNRLVAGALHDYRLSTLLFDLLTEDEAEHRPHVFDIALLSQRVLHALDWVDSRADLADRRVGLFGASTGAAAALRAAAERPERLCAVVSRGGRPDLAAAYLARVQAPTLLIVGGNDTEVLELNRGALAGLRCEKRLDVLPGSTHLFEEPGALEAVAHLAGAWFANHCPEAQ